MVSKSETEDETETEEELEKDVFIPPNDLPNQKTIWSEDGLLRCIYTTEKENRDEIIFRPHIFRYYCKYPLMVNRSLFGS